MLGKTIADILGADDAASAWFGKEAYQSTVSFVIAPAAHGAVLIVEARRRGLHGMDEEIIPVETLAAGFGGIKKLDSFDDLSYRIRVVSGWSEPIRVSAHRRRGERPW